MIAAILGIVSALIAGLLPIVIGYLKRNLDASNSPQGKRDKSQSETASAIVNKAKSINDVNSDINRELDRVLHTSK